MTMYAQGDLLFVKVAQAAGVPVGPEQGRLIMAYGEVTGHHHSVAVRAGLTLTRVDEGVQYLTIDELLGPAVVEHQEHGPITLDPGIWEVRRQREWTDADEPMFVGD